MIHALSKKQDPYESGRFFRHVIVNPKDMELLLDAFEVRGFRIIFYIRGEKFRNLNEAIREHGSHVNELEIRGYHKKLGFVSVRFHNGHARIRAGGSFVAKELEHKLALFMSARQSIKKRISSWAGWCVVSFAAFMAEFVLLFLEPVRSEIPLSFHAYLWVAILLWPVFFVVKRFLSPVGIRTPALIF